MPKTAESPSLLEVDTLGTAVQKTMQIKSVLFEHQHSETE